MFKPWIRSFLQVQQDFVTSETLRKVALRSPRMAPWRKLGITFGDGWYFILMDVAYLHDGKHVGMSENGVYPQ